MPDIIGSLKTVQDCRNLEKNATERANHELALQARKRRFELQAATHNAKNEAECECLEAVYAYEEVLSQRAGKTIRASRTWQTIKKHGIISAVDRLVSRANETQGYRELAGMGLQKYTFEQTVLRYPNLFSDGAVQQAQSRIATVGSERAS